MSVTKSGVPQGLNNLDSRAADKYHRLNWSDHPSNLGWPGPRSSREGGIAGLSRSTAQRRNQARQAEDARGADPSLARLSREVPSAANRSAPGVCVGGHE